MTVFTATPVVASVSTLSWSAAVACQIRVTSPTGTLFASGGTSGSATTGAWASVGMQFFLLSTTGTVLASLALTGSSPLKKGIATDFGAKGDGVTDDTAAINSALSACYDLEFPPGDYRLSSRLTVSNPGRIHGAGQGLTTFTMIAGSSCPEMWRVNNGNVRFSGFSCDGNIANLGISLGTSRWTPNTQYWSDPSQGTGYGGGPDCVYYNDSIYKCLANHTDSLPPPASSLWQKMYSGLTPKQQMNMVSGILFSVDCGGWCSWDDIELLGSQFGIFLYSGKDYRIKDCYAHEFGIQYLGNNATMDAVHTMPGVDVLRVLDCDFENIYVPITGPGATSAIFSCTSDTIVSGNRVLNCLNRGGGSIVGAGNSKPGSLPSTWIVANNAVTRDYAGHWLKDYTCGIEVEANAAAVTGNVVTGFMGGISVSNLQGSNAGPFSVAGNVVVGDDSTGPVQNGISVVSINGVTDSVAISANSISHFGTGIRVWPGSTNVLVGTDNLISDCPVKVLLS